MRHASGPAARDVVAGGFETSARFGEGRIASAPALWPCSRNAVRSEAAQTSGAVGGRISKVLGRIARSPGRVFGKDDDQTTATERSEIERNVSRLLCKHDAGRGKRDVERRSGCIRAE